MNYSWKCFLSNSRKEIKFLGLLNPTFELVGGKKLRRKTYKKNHKKRNARKTRRNMHK